MLTNNQIVLEQELLGSIFKNNNLMLKAREKNKARDVFILKAYEYLFRDFRYGCK